jgi:Flp pilus assembly protein TadG
MNIMRAFKLQLHGFGAGERGSMPAEGVMAATVLIWWYIASFQFFDAYRQKNINLKAAYTVADMLSRETGPVPGDPNSTPINQAYISGLNTVFEYLTYSKKPTWVRVSSVYWDDDQHKYRIDWSANSAPNHEVMTTVKLQDYANRIPVLPVGDTVIVVETFMAYEPIFNMGLDAQWFTTFITTAPRFASCLPWENNGCGTDSGGDWVNPDLTDLPDMTYDP